MTIILLFLLAFDVLNSNSSPGENSGEVEIVVLSADTLEATVNLSVMIELEMRNNTDTAIVVPMPQKVDRDDYKDYRPEFFRIKYWNCFNDEFIDFDTYNKPISMYREIEPGGRMSFTINPSEYDLWPCTFVNGDLTQVQIIYEPLPIFLTVDYVQELIAESPEDKDEIERQFGKLLRTEVKSGIITLKII